jgi:hypothetical protein
MFETFLQNEGQVLLVSGVFSIGNVVNLNVNLLNLLCGLSRRGVRALQMNGI